MVGSLASWDAGITAAGLDLTWIGKKLGIETDPPELEAPTDDIRERAEKSATNFTEAFRKALASMSPREALANAGWRLDRIAATDNSTWFNEARHTTVVTAVLAVGKPGGLVEIWDAQLDACKLCWEYDGEKHPIGASYSGGARPGEVHCSCRCTDHYALE